MACVRMYEVDITDDGVPSVCMQCGRPADVRGHKTFQWHPRWVYILLLLGLLPFVIVALALTKRRRVCTPFCGRHAGYWRFRTAFVVVGILAIILAVVGLVAAADKGPGPSPPWVGTAGGILVLLGVGWLMSALVLQATSIRTDEITATKITLVGVHAAFAEEVRRRQDELRAKDLDPNARLRNWPRSQRSEFYDG